MSEEEQKKIERLKKSIKEVANVKKFCQRNKRNTSRVSYLERGHDAGMIDDAIVTNHPKGYKALLEAFTIIHEYKTKARNPKLRATLKNISELVENLQEKFSVLNFFRTKKSYAKKIVKKLTDKKYHHADEMNKEAFNSITMSFFNRNKWDNGHAMAAQIREYDNEVFSIALFNHASLLPYYLTTPNKDQNSRLPNTTTIPAVTEYFVPKDKLEKFIKMSFDDAFFGSMPKILDFLEENNTHKYEKRDLPQFHQNCPSHAIGVLINDSFGLYEGDKDAAILAGEFRDFVENYNSKLILSQLENIKKEQQEELNKLLKPISKTPHSTKSSEAPPLKPAGKIKNPQGVQLNKRIARRKVGIEPDDDTHSNGCR